MRIKHRKTRDVTVLEDVTGVFVAIGHKPNTDLFKEVLTMDDGVYSNKGTIYKTDLPVFLLVVMLWILLQAAVTAAAWVVKPP